MFFCLYNTNTHFFFILFSCIYQIDRDGANPEQVIQELSSIGRMPEDWGGDNPMVQVTIISCIF